MSTFKRIPGFPNYAVNDNGLVYDLVNKKNVKKFIMNNRNSGVIDSNYIRCSVDGLTRCVTTLMIITHLGGEFRKNIYFNYKDGNHNNLHLSNINWFYKRNTRKITESFVNHISKIQLDSEGVEMESPNEEDNLNVNKDKLSIIKKTKASKLSESALM